MNEYTNMILYAVLYVVSINVLIVFICRLEAEIWHISYCGRSGPFTSAKSNILQKVMSDGKKCYCSQYFILNLIGEMEMLHEFSPK